MTTTMSRTTIPPVHRPEYSVRHPFALICAGVVAFLVVIAVLGFGLTALAAG